MPDSLPRRTILTGGAAMAATAVLVAPSLANAAPAAQAPTETVVVRWNAKTRRWAARPAQADFGVVFLSTNDPDATPPSDHHIQAGDVWRRHPDAVAA